MSSTTTLGKHCALSVQTQQVSLTRPSLSEPDGPVYHTLARNALPSVTGAANNTGNHSAIDSVGGVPHGNGVSRVPFTPQPDGFMIPGLGAPFKPLNLDDKKTSSSSPLQARSLLAGPHFQGHGGSSGIFDLAKQSASKSVDTSATHNQQKPLGVAALETGSRLSPLKQDSSVSSKALAADQVDKTMMKDHASPDASFTPEKSQASISPSGAAKEVEYIRPSGPPPVWVQKQAPRIFKQVRAQNNNTSFETFGGASSILSGMNPDHYSMPYGVSTNVNTSSILLN